MKLLVTGASGYLGTKLCQFILQRGGHEVRASDISVRREHPCRVEVASLLERERCYGLCEDIEGIIHLGNHNNAWRGTAQQVYGENVTMNMNLFQAAVEQGVGKVVFASSIQVIAGRLTLADNKPSELAYLPVDSETPANPGNSYALSKRTGELMLEYFHYVHGLDSVALRLPSTQHAFPSYYRDGIDGTPFPEAFPRGFSLDEAMTMLDPRDAFELMLRCLEQELPGARRYLPASPKPLFSNLPVPEIVERYYPEVPLRQPREAMGALCDVSRITEETGWRPVHEPVWSEGY
jgi:nucleoside-diphosphate-sugar epimerase